MSASSDPAPPAAATARTSSPVGTVAERVHRDLSGGVNVVVASYVGLWYEHRRDPARNLYWGNLYGHSAFLPRRTEIRGRLPFLEVTSYTSTLDRRYTRDPIAVRVFETSVPEATGKLKIVTLAYADMGRAVREMAMHLKTGAVPPSLAADAVLGPLLRQAYVIGYWGHNIYYGGLDTDDLERVSRTTQDLPRGVFFVGCQSARWFPQKFLDGAVEPLLFTTTNMAPEAYIAVALYDGLARGLGRDATRRNVARAYAIYQRLGNPPVSLFLNDRVAIEAKRQPIPGERATSGTEVRKVPPALLTGAEIQGRREFPERSGSDSGRP